MARDPASAGGSTQAGSSFRIDGDDNDDDESTQVIWARWTWQSLAVLRVDVWSGQERLATNYS